MLPAATELNLAAPSARINLAYCGTESTAYLLKELPADFYSQIFSPKELMEQAIQSTGKLKNFDILLLEVDISEKYIRFIEELRKKDHYKNLIIVLLATVEKEYLKHKALELRVNDFYLLPLVSEHIVERLRFLFHYRSLKSKLRILPEKAADSYKLPIIKRSFDLIVSISLIIITFPGIVLSVFLVKCIGRRPVILKTRRRGSGFREFDSYSLNTSAIPDNNYPLRTVISYKPLLVQPAEGNHWLINLLIRTRIDKLPQLINVIKGELSIIGIRPLYLQESENLGYEHLRVRYQVPAGFAGLWLLDKDSPYENGNSTEDRTNSKYSFLNDIQILIKILYHCLIKTAR